MKLLSSASTLFYFLLGSSLAKDVVGQRNLRVRGLQFDAFDEAGLIPGVYDSDVLASKKTGGSQDDDDPNSACCGPSKKPGFLVFEVTGATCVLGSSGLLEQGTSKSSCSPEDNDLLPSGPYSVTAESKDGENFFGIEVGETFTVDFEEFDSNTFLTLRKGNEKLQEVKVHTSCSVSLLLNQEWGSFKLVGCRRVGERIAVVVLVSFWYIRI